MNRRNIWLAFGLILAFQLALISHLTLFLTPEFSVYPYFVSQGMLPYINIIDQHFPVLFFGPLNLSWFGLYQPQNLKFVFLGLLVFNNFVFFQFIAHKTRSLFQLASIQLGFVVALTLLAVNHLWLESFCLAFVFVSLLLLQKKDPRAHFLAGVFLAITAITRILLVPFLIILWLPYWRRRSVIVGGLVTALWILTWLVMTHTLVPFLQMLSFNGQYAKEATQLPSRSDIIRLSWVVGWVWVTLQPSLITILAGAATLLPSFPRFELFHNLLLVSIPAFSGAKLRRSLLYLPWLALGLFLVIRQTTREADINFFYPPSLVSQAATINKLGVKQIYFYGGPDQLYVMTNSLPPDNFYLPSLPWYHHQAEWEDRQITALGNNPQALVVINRDSQINGQNLLDYSQPLYQYIKSNYYLVEVIDHLEVWTRQSPLAAAL